MIKIEAATLEEAYKNAAESLKCSVTELKIEVTQVPNNGFCGFFKKSAIIVAIREVNSKPAVQTTSSVDEDKQGTIQHTTETTAVNKVKIEEKVKTLTDQRYFQT